MSRENEDKEPQRDTGSLVLVGTSEAMEVSVSHLTLFTDLCVEFVGPQGIRKPPADMQGA